MLTPLPASGQFKVCSGTARAGSGPGEATFTSTRSGTSPAGSLGSPWRRGAMEKGRKEDSRMMPGLGDLAGGIVEDGKRRRKLCQGLGDLLGLVFQVHQELSDFQVAQLQGLEGRVGGQGDVLPGGTAVQAEFADD